jgi:hypothetical protein
LQRGLSSIPPVVRPANIKKNHPQNLVFQQPARSIPPADVARSFIPPSPHFGRLLARNHTLLLGPRGSGKTTLLKMLTARALNSWTHPDALTLAPQVNFNAAFIPPDIAWGGQIEAIGSLDFNSGRKDAAFVLHTLRAIIHATLSGLPRLASRGPPSKPFFKRTQSGNGIFMRGIQNLAECKRGGVV